MRATLPMLACLVLAESASALEMKGFKPAKSVVYKTIELTGKKTGHHGIRVGDLSGDQKDHVRKVIADLHTPSLMIEDGAFLEGQCAMERHKKAVHSSKKVAHMPIGERSIG